MILLLKELLIHIEYGYKIGLVSPDRYQRFLQNRALIDQAKEQLKKAYLTPIRSINEYLEMHRKAPITDKISTYALLKRPDITLEDTIKLIKKLKKYYKWKIVKSQRILITMLFPI